MVLTPYLPPPHPGLGRAPSVERLLKGEEIKDLAFSGNGRRFAIGLNDGTLQLYRRRGLRWVHFGSLARRKWDRQASWSYDGSTLCWMTGPVKNAVVWRPGKSAPAAFSIPHQNDELDQLELSFDGKWFAGTGTWEVSWGRTSRGKVERKLTYGLEEHPEILFAGNSELLVGTTSLERYSLPSGNKTVLARRTGYTMKLALDYPHRRLAALVFKNTIHIRALGSGRILRRIHTGPGYPDSVAWPGDGKYLACELCADHRRADPNWYTRILVLRYPSGERIAKRQLRDPEVGKVVFGPSASTLFFSSLYDYWTPWNIKRRHLKP